MLVPESVDQLRRRARTAVPGARGRATAALERRRGDRDPPTVLVVGPGPYSQSGVWSVVEKLIGSSLAWRFDLLTEATHRGPSATGSHGALKAAQAALGLVRVTARLARGVDVVYVHVSWGWSLRRKAVVAELTRVFGRPYVLHVHGSR